MGVVDHSGGYEAGFKNWPQQQAELHERPMIRRRRVLIAPKVVGATGIKPINVLSKYH